MSQTDRLLEEARGHLLKYLIVRAHDIVDRFKVGNSSARAHDIVDTWMGFRVEQTAG